MSYPAKRDEVPRTVVEDAAAGNRAAFTELVAAYHHDMLRLCLVITGDHDLANDAAQAAWHRAWRKLRQLRDPARVRSWLLTVAANEARQAFRRQGRVVAMAPEAIDRPGTEVDQIEHIDLVNALRRLQPDERRLIALRYVSGFSSVELADAMRLTPEGVRTRLKRIVDRLRKELDNE